MGLIKNKIGKQGRWPSALFLFFLPLILIFIVRWFIVEPFVIPSESMQPNLLIHDHILVKKYSYGIKPPVGDGWWWKSHQPERGDIIVFRYPENRNVFFIKRLIGLPGDVIEVQGRDLTINGTIYSQEATADSFIFIENNGVKKYQVSFAAEAGAEQVANSETFVVPAKSYFVMGDNRFGSHDSRFWGFVPEDLLIGKAQLIWLSCQKTLVSLPFVCDPSFLRPERFFQGIE